MHCIEINDGLSLPIIQQINLELKGEFVDEGFEEYLKFGTSIGIGTIKSMIFDHGISYLEMDVIFHEMTRLSYIFKKTPIKFLYISEGCLSYVNDSNQTSLDLERFQNIILANQNNSKSNYIFQSRIRTKVHIVMVDYQKFITKCNFRSNEFHGNISAFLNGLDSHVPFEHLGNYNLSIADVFKNIDSFTGNVFVRSLLIEAQILSILAKQLQDYEDYSTNKYLRHSLSIIELNKVRALSNFIFENMSSYSLTIKDLVEESGLSPKKLQLGFKILHSKSINEYVRHKKMEYARDLIKNSHYNISEIVYRIGYRSRSYFSKLFFETYEILPTEYRDLCRKKNIKN